MARDPIPVAPWLQSEDQQGAPAPPPVKVKRKMGRLERALRGRHKDES